jgi:glycine cleavage system H lipoate-binding protein
MLISRVITNGFLSTGTQRIGITRYAQEQLGDLVHVPLPKPHAVLKAGAPAAVVEKAA